MTSFYDRSHCSSKPAAEHIGLLHAAFPGWIQGTGSSSRPDRHLDESTGYSEFGPHRTMLIGGLPLAIGVAANGAGDHAFGDQQVTDRSKRGNVHAEG